MPRTNLEPQSSRRARRLLVATWALWLVSLIATPLTAVGFQTFIAPAKDDDFGMGPFLTGAILGGILCVIAGIAAIAVSVRMRRVYPLRRRWLLVIERLILVSPPAVLLAAAAGLIASGPIGGAFVFLAVAALALVTIR